MLSEAQNFDYIGEKTCSYLYCTLILNYCFPTSAVFNFLFLYNQMHYFIKCENYSQIRKQKFMFGYNFKISYLKEA